MSALEPELKTYAMLWRKVDPAVAKTLITALAIPFTGIQNSPKDEITAMMCSVFLTSIKAISSDASVRSGLGMFGASFEVQKESIICSTCNATIVEQASITSSTYAFRSSKSANTLNVR